MWTPCVSCAIGTEFFKAYLGDFQNSVGWKRIAKSACDLFHRYGQEVKDHPAYNLDLAPCGYDFFGLFTNRLVGKGFERDADVKKAVTPWIQLFDIYFL